MVAAVRDNLPKIIEACKQMQVKSLYLVGSAARETDFTPNSDVDFTIQFLKGKDGMPIGGYDYFEFLEQMETITGRSVDLLAEERIRNKYLMKSLAEDRIEIYAA